MKREFRLTRSTDIERVRQSGKSYSHPLVVLIAAPNELGKIRIAVVAGRSVGGAVLRNRAKRLLRASLDSIFSGLALGWDIVFLARRPLPEAGFGKTRVALEIVLRRARLYSPGAQPDE